MAWVRYDYECITCKVRWDELVERGTEDNVDCPTCGDRARRLLSSPYFSKFNQPLNYKEQGIKADLQAANDIDKSLAYGELKTADEKTQKEVAKEYNRRKFE